VFVQAPVDTFVLECKRHRQTDRQTDGQTDDSVMPIADHT